MLYKYIPNLKPYAINRYGVVVNTSTGSIVKQHKNNSGYYTVNLTPEGSTRANYFIHRLVCLTYKPNKNTKMHVNHKDLNPSNNYYKNLEWCTPRENNTYSAYHSDRFKQTPIFSRNIYTKIIKQYDSIFQCAKDMGLTSDAVIYRLNSVFGSIFDGYQFKKVKDIRAWIELDNIKILSMQKEYRKLIYLKKNGIAIELKSQREAAKYLKISESTMNKFVKLRHKFKFNGFSICKKYDSNWDSTLPEWYTNINPKYRITDGDIVKDYTSLKEVAKTIKISNSTLLYKIQRCKDNHITINNYKIEILQ